MSDKEAWEGCYKIEFQVFKLGAGWYWVPRSNPENVKGAFCNSRTAFLDALHGHDWMDVSKNSNNPLEDKLTIKVWNEIGSDRWWWAYYNEVLNPVMQGNVEGPFKSRSEALADASKPSKYPDITVYKRSGKWFWCEYTKPPLERGPFDSRRQALEHAAAINKDSV